jgi:hypothetical protein
MLDGAVVVVFFVAGMVRLVMVLMLPFLGVG